MNPIRLARHAAAYWADFARLGKEARQAFNVSRWRMIREHWALRRLNRLHRNEYFYYGLYNPNMPWEQKTEYLGAALMRPLWSALNPIEYRYLFKNKLIFKQACLSQGLPVAPLIGVFDPDWGYTADGRSLRTADDLRRWIADLEDGNVVMKPCEGAEGSMVLVFGDKSEGPEPTLIALDGTAYTPQQIFDFMTDEERLARACSGAPAISPTILIEKRVRSHPNLARLSPATLCTFRIVTLCERGMGAEIIAAVFKLQTAATGKDNLHEGSMAIGVAVRDGVLQSGWRVAQDYYRGDRRRFNTLPSVNRLDTDPTTGIRFAGLKVPMWSDVMATALKAAATFPYGRVIGWDIAVTPGGPCIIEGNWAWGERLAQAGAGRGIYRGRFKKVCERLIREGKADKALV